MTDDAAVVRYFPQQAAEGPYLEAIFKGPLTIYNGCFILGAAPHGNTVVWNRSARLGQDRKSVTDTATGRTVRAGEQVRLNGGKVPLDQWGRSNLVEAFPNGCPTEIIVVGEGFEKVQG
jgi:hypothetical protein